MKKLLLILFIVSSSLFVFGQGYSTRGATEAQLATKADKVSPAVEDNIAVLDADGNLVDGGSSITDVVGEATRILTYYVRGGSNGPIASTKLASLSSSALEPVYTNITTGVTNGMLIGTYSIKNDELPDVISEGIFNVYANLSRTGLGPTPRLVRAVLRVIESNGTTEVSSYTNAALPTIVVPTVTDEVRAIVPIVGATGLNEGLGRMIRVDFYALSGWVGTESISSYSQDGYLTRFELPASPIGVFALNSELDLKVDIDGGISTRENSTNYVSRVYTNGQLVITEVYNGTTNTYYDFTD